MELELTSLTDKEGPVVYLIGSTMLEDKLLPLGKQIDELIQDQTQVAYLDMNSDNGAAVMELYAVSPDYLPVIMIVMDDDTVYKTWSGDDLPEAQVVVYEIGQITGASAA